MEFGRWFRNSNFVVSFFSKAFVRQRNVCNKNTIVMVIASLSGGELFLAFLLYAFQLSIWNFVFLMRLNR